MDWLGARRAVAALRAVPAAGAASGRRTPALPAPLQAVGEALADGARVGRVTEACHVAGGMLADEGVALGECLDGLRTVTRLVRRRDPRYEESHALAFAWSEATLGYLHRLTCLDPLTGLATRAHLRERILELYRAVEHPPHALVVTQAAVRAPDDSLGTARALTLLGRTVRAVFDGAEAIGHVGADRLVVIAACDERLAGRVALLERMARPAAARVWIERLPDTADRAGTLLEELARGS